MRAFKKCGMAPLKGPISLVLVGSFTGRALHGSSVPRCPSAASGSRAGDVPSV